VLEIPPWECEGGGDLDLSIYPGYELEWNGLKIYYGQVKGRGS
jgi:hypothetical protein